MRPWQTKAIRDSLKAALPFQKPLRRFARSVRGFDTNPLNDPGLLGDSLRQLNALRRLGVTVQGAAIVEIGTGWKPVLALVYRLAGARTVVTVDQERLIDARTFKGAATFIAKNIEAMKIKTGISLALYPDRIDVSANTLDDLVAMNHIDYKAPFDFCDLAAGSADIIVSRDVLEHIPEHWLEKILTHSRDVLKDGGVLCHTIDMSDHWEHADKSISRVNFLKYNDGLLWKLAGANAQNYQNRLRRFEYIEMFERNGFEVLADNGAPNAHALAALQGMSVCRKYSAVPPEELAILNTTIIARKY